MKITLSLLALFLGCSLSFSQSLTSIPLPESCTVGQYSENDTIAVMSTGWKNLYYRYKHDTVWTQITTEPFDTYYQISVYNTHIYVMASKANDISLSGLLESTDLGLTWTQKFSESFLTSHLIAYPSLFASDDNSFSIWNGSELKNCVYFSGTVTDITPSVIIYPHKLQYWGGTLYVHDYNNTSGSVIGGAVEYSSTFSTWSFHGGPATSLQNVATERGSYQLFVDRGTGYFYTSNTGGFPFNQWQFNSGSDYSSNFNIICGYGNFYVIKNLHDIYHSSNGITWNHFFNTTTTQATPLEVLPNGNLLLKTGALIEYDPVNSTMKPFTHGIHEAGITDASINAANDVFISADGVKYFRQSGQSDWKFITEAANGVQPHVSDNGLLYLAGYNPSLMRSNNNGNSFIPLLDNNFTYSFNYQYMLFKNDSILLLDIDSVKTSNNGGNTYTATAAAYADSVDMLFFAATNRDRKELAINVRYINSVEQLFYTNDFGNTWTASHLTNYIGDTYGTYFAIDSSFYYIKVNPAATDTIYQIFPSYYQMVNVFTNNPGDSILEKNFWAEGNQFFLQQVVMNNQQYYFQIYKSTTTAGSFTQLFSVPISGQTFFNQGSFANCRTKKLFWSVHDKLYLFEDNTAFPSQVATGRVYYDINNNNVFDTVEVAMHSFIVGNGSGNTILSDPSGVYSYTPATSNDVITVVPPNYFSSTPLQHTVNAGDTGKDFALHSIGNVNDLSIHTAHATPYVIGSNSNTNITYTNNGNTTLSPAVTYVKDSAINYYSFSPLPDYLGGDTAIWNLPPLPPGQHASINITEYTDPSIIIGTPVITHTGVEPLSGDSTPSNNSDSTYSLATGSFDPNYKEVQPEIYTLSNLINNDDLYFTVHFQNTGTYAAFYVSVTDTLSPYLNIASFEMINSSHPGYVAQISNGNVLTVSYNGINLPDSLTDPEGSKGFFVFRIKPVPGWSVNDIILNTAYIYFDFNAPVVTNTVICAQAASVTENSGRANVLVYPNPSSGNIYFMIGKPFTKLTLFNVLGEEVYSTNHASSLVMIDMSQLSPGVYFYEIAMTSGRITGKVIRQ